MLVEMLGFVTLILSPIGVFCPNYWNWEELPNYSFPQKFLHNVILDHELQTKMHLFPWPLNYSIFTFNSWFSHGEKLLYLRVHDTHHHLVSWNPLNVGHWNKVCYSWMHQWTQRIICWRFLIQSLCGLVFCKHLSTVFIVASNIQLIMDCFVISIQGPPFVHVGYFIAVMSSMTIGQYYFRNALPFCDFYLHIVFWINNVQVGFVFNFLYTYEGKHFCILPIGLFGLSCFDFYIVRVYNFTFPFALSSYIWYSTIVFIKDFDVYKISNSPYLHTFQVVFSIQYCFAFCFL